MNVRFIRLLQNEQRNPLELGIAFYSNQVMRLRLYALKYLQGLSCLSDLSSRSRLDHRNATSGQVHLEGNFSLKEAPISEIKYLELLPREEA